MSEATLQIPAELAFTIAELLKDHGPVPIWDKKKWEAVKEWLTTQGVKDDRILSSQAGQCYGPRLRKIYAAQDEVRERLRQVRRQDWYRRRCT